MDGPLVTGRVEFGSALVSALEERWNADDEGGLDCPVPGHDGRGRLGVPPDDPDGDVRLLCCRGRWRSLGEVRAADAYGVDGKRSNIELATWTRRLAHELGGFVPLEVSLPPAAHEAPAEVHAVRVGFALLVGLRWADGPHRPVAWSIRFAAVWCGLTFRQARMANELLEAAGVIVQAGQRGRNRLFVPGDVPPKLAVVDGGPGSTAEERRAARFERDYPESDYPEFRQ